MELDELIPERVEWIPKFTNEKNEEKEISFHFRPFNLEDESWLKREFGEKALAEIFEQMKMREISRIAFRQLEIDSKRRLMEMKFIDIDEDGEEIEIATKGPEKLSALIVGLPQQLELLKMLLRTRGVSMPILEKLGETLVEEEKKARTLLDQK